MSEPAKETPPQPSATEVWIIRTTAILAVLAALSSGRWGASNLRAILEQGKVNDSWSYYQAKSIKQNVAQNSADLAGALHGDTALVQSFRAAAAKYDKEKREIEEEARYFQNQRNHHVEQSLWFEFSFACIQLGVVICTIASATRSKRLWATSITFGLVGLVLFLNGFFLWTKLGENPLSKSFIKSMDGSAK